MGQLFEIKAKRAGFGPIFIYVFVALPDNTVLFCPKESAIDFLCKAEQVPERVTQLLKERPPSGGSLGSLKEVPRSAKTN